MEHQLRVFVGPQNALARLVVGLEDAHAIRLSPASTLLVLPLDDGLHDRLHRRHGTGEWLERGSRLTTTDIAAAAVASRGAVLAYIETDYVDAAGSQSAAVWHDGEVSMKPVSMAMAEIATRPPQFWPVNAALRGLGIAATPDADEFTVFGLADCRNHAHLVARGVPVRLTA